jgi:LuxR family maltose regulon positive regulatory protein
MTQREIGGELYVSLNTVKSHTKNIFRKLSASNRSEAVARARELGIL